MEIDFMGLYSKNSAPTERSGYEAEAFLDSGVGNVSLSLCTSSPMDEKTVFQDLLRKKIRKSPEENMNSVRIPACNYDWENAQQSCPSLVGKPILRHSVFRYNCNDRSTISRNKFECPLPFPAASTLFGPTAAPNSIHEQKADRKMFATGDASFDDTRKSTDGYTPTVAMARKATLARFLEKRSHRLNQQMKPHLMGRSMNWSEPCDTTFKKNNSSMQYEVLM